MLDSASQLGALASLELLSPPMGGILVVFCPLLCCGVFLLILCLGWWIGKRIIILFYPSLFAGLDDERKRDVAPFAFYDFCRRKSEG